MRKYLRLISFAICLLTVFFAFNTNLLFDNTSEARIVTREWPGTLKTCEGGVMCCCSNPANDCTFYIHVYIPEN